MTALQFPRLGYGAMQLTWKPEPAEDDQAFATLKMAIDAGCTMINSGEFYSNARTDGANLRMLGRFYEQYPQYIDKTFLSVKGGADLATLMPDATTSNLRESVTNINKHLGGKKKMDLFECARVDKKRPVEEVMKDLLDLRDEGHFQHIGLSECSAETIRRASKIAPIAAVEIEYSLWSIDIEQNGVKQACEELGIPIVAYSPLGRGALSGSFDPKSLQQGDFRGMCDRFQPEAWEKNKKFVDQIKQMAEKKGISNSQLALAWVMKQGAIPIFGATRPVTCEDSVGSLKVELSDAEMQEIRKMIESADIEGGRYFAAMESTLAV